MPTYQVTDPATGKKYRLTGDAPPTEAELESILGPAPQAAPQVNDLYSADPTEGMGAVSKFFAGAGKAFTDLGRGAAQLFGADNQQAIDEAAARDAPLMETGAGIAGNIAGGVAASLPLMAIPGANTVAGAAGVGALTGALQPVESGQDRGGNILAGAAGGAAGQGVLTGVSKMLNPAIRDSVKKIIEGGVTPTPGQILGGGWAKLESAAESIPFVGEGIKGAKTRAIKEFNTSVINKALAPIGATVKDVGHEGMTRARDAVEKAYDTAIDLVPLVDFGPQSAGTAVANVGESAAPNFWSNIAKIKEMGSTLKPEYSKQLDSIIQKDLIDKITPAGTLSGESAMTAKNEFARNARNFRKGNPGRDDLQIADALDAVKQEILGKISEMDPTAREIIRKADASHAMLMRVERAAQMQGAPDGVFTPAQFGNAVRALDPSLRKKAVGQGKALMQDIATSARDVLGEKLPSSGTSERLLSAGALGGLTTGALFAHPAPLVGGLAARGAYTEPAQKILAALLTERPDALREAGDLVRLAAPAGGLVGVQGVLNAE